MDQDCIFCKIAAGEIDSKKLYQDDQVTAFRDIHPSAKIHVLIIPNKHIPSINELEPEDEPLIGHLFTVAKQLAEQEGTAEQGYRLMINTGPHAGQAVFHIHLHLLGGQPMRHPMG